MTFHKRFKAIFSGGRKREIKRLNDYLDRVLAGDNNLEIWDNEEGELSILKSNVYKATTILVSQREQLKKDRNYLADAMADISHQLKTPLTSMMVMNDLLLSEEDEDKRKEFLQTQSVQLSKMNWLIQNLLKISKLDADCITFKEDETNTTTLVKESLSDFLVSMDIKEIKVIDHTTGIPMKCDRNWSEEALKNIIKNCIEHMNPGGVLTLEDEDTGVYTKIVIRDTGCGIAKEDLGHIFERFYRGKESGSESVGIGLALAKTIIEKQHGEITAQSEVGAGSSFEIKFYKTII